MGKLQVNVGFGEVRLFAGQGQTFDADGSFGTGVAKILVSLHFRLGKGHGVQGHQPLCLFVCVVALTQEFVGARPSQLKLFLLRLVEGVAGKRRESVGQLQGPL